MATSTQPLAVIARLLDLTERRVQQLARDGVIPPSAQIGPERGRYDPVGAVRGYIRFLREQAARAQSGAADFGAERARLVKAKADRAEMEAARMRDDLIPASDVAEAWTEMVASMRARLLALPDKIAPVIHETTSIAEARDAVRHAVFEALGELAATQIRRRPPTRGDGGADADGHGGPAGGGSAAEPDGDGMGGPEPQA
jgi:phage terminase Nu1 subunit (DNA packaging protein)